MTARTHRVIANIFITLTFGALASISFLVAYFLFTWNKWIAIASVPVTAIATLYAISLIDDYDPLDKKHLGMIADFIPVEGGGYRCYHEELERPNKVTVFKNYVLRLLAVQFLIAGILYLLLAQWWPATLTLTVTFLFELVVRVVNRVAQGEEALKRESDIADAVLLVTCGLVTVTSVAICLHHNLFWYLIVPLTLITGILYPTLLMQISYRLCDDALVRRQRRERESHRI